MSCAEYRKHLMKIKAIFFITVIWMIFKLYVQPPQQFPTSYSVSSYLLGSKKRIVHMLQRHLHST